MPPKKVSKAASNADNSKTGAKTRSSAKSATPAAAATAPSSDKKKIPAKTKKALKPVEKDVEEIVAADEDNVAGEEGASPENSELWQLTIKTMRGNFTVRIPPTAGVMDLKEKIFEMQGFPVENQRLMFHSKIFTENHPLTVYDVTNGSEIYFVFRMCGI